jgi:hypothetical protein
MVTKWRRSRIFLELLELVASLPDSHLLCVALDSAGRRDPQLDAWDRLLNRLNRLAEGRNRQENSLRRRLIKGLGEQGDAVAMREVERRLLPYSAQAVLIADQGHETEIVRLRRKLSVYNPVPSKFGSWGGATTKNIPLTHFVEDPLFRDSAHSYLVQLADCAAFALLKRETHPTPQIKKYGLHRAFDAHLAGICVRQANSKDSLGIVRR